MSNGQVIRAIEPGNLPEPADWKIYRLHPQTRDAAGPWDFVRLGEIDQFSHAAFVIRMNDVGNFVLDGDPYCKGLMEAIPFVDGVAQQIELVINGESVFMGPLQGIERRLDSNNEQVTLHGADQNIGLARRVVSPVGYSNNTTRSPTFPSRYSYADHELWRQERVWEGESPNVFTGDYHTTPTSFLGGYDDYNGIASQVIEWFVRNNLGPIAGQYEPYGRQECLVPGSPLVGNSVQGSQGRFQNLLTFIQGIAVQGGPPTLAFRIHRGTFSVHRPVHKGVIFAVGAGNIKRYVSTYDADDANVVWVAGQGEERFRQVAMYHGYGRNFGTTVQPPVYPDIAYPPPFGRVETFRDRRDTNEWQTLINASVEDCKKGIHRPRVRVDAMDTPLQRFGRDYNLADLVTVRLGVGPTADEIEAGITSLTFQLEPGKPPTIVPTIGTELAIAPLRFLQRLDDSTARVNQLERR